MRRNIFNIQGVDLFVIDNFLTLDECNHICRLIKQDHSPSTVVSNGSEERIHDNGRTSQSAFLDNNDSIVERINERISTELNLPENHGEPLQGQLYRQGEYYKDHHDYFDDETLRRQFAHSGQRTWTAMIYVNEVLGGGHTEFPHLGKSIAPSKGMGVFWKNSDGAGAEDPNTLHSGRPVLEGEKMIITKWFRENIVSIELDVKSKELLDSKELTTVKGFDGSTHKVKIEYVNGIPHARYKSNSEIPALTTQGFKKMRIPTILYEEILTYYHQGLASSSPEFNPENKQEHLNDFIFSKESKFPTQMIPLSDHMKAKIFDGLIEELENWAHRKLESTYCYGIRTYNRGAVLKKHTDGFDTRIVSAILNIDQQVDEPWALQIDDHSGKEHEVYLDAGEMVFYESAILEHGRVKPFKGNYFSNLFVHYINVT